MSSSTLMTAWCVADDIADGETDRVTARKSLMNLSINAFQDLLLHLHCETFEESAWGTFLEKFRITMGARSLSLILKDPQRNDRGMLFHVGGHIEWQEQYEEYFYAIDPLMSIPSGKPVTLMELLGNRQLTRTEYYRGFMRPLDLTDSLGMDGIVQNGQRLRIRVSRYSDEPSFDETDKELLGLIMPHAVFALRNQSRFLQSRSGNRLLHQALGMFDVGTLLIDTSSMIIDVNDIALMRLEPFGRIKRGEKLTFNNKQLGVRFQEIIQDISNSEYYAHITRVMRLTRAGNSDLSFIITKVPLQSETGRKPGEILAFVIDPYREPALRPEWISMLFGITPAEAALACSLATGVTPELAAHERGVSINTVRSQIRSLYRKMGVSRQTDLVRVLLHSAGGI